MKTILLPLLTLLLLAACSKKTEPDPNSVAFNGTVTYIDLEGGAWILRADDGQRYEPMNLAEEYKVEGLRVAVTGQVQQDMASTLMVGKILQITEIRRI